MWKVSRKDNTPNGINRVYAKVNIGSDYESEVISHLMYHEGEWMSFDGDIIGEDDTKVLYFFDYSNYPSPQQQLD